MPPKKSQLSFVTDPAPWYGVPAQQIVSVEHPCLIKNNEKGIQMLGGAKGIRNAVDPELCNRSVSLSLHPENPVTRTLSSVMCPTNNVLLKITVPKRTGRKRKRGSDDPYEHDVLQLSPRKDARYLLQSLADNVENNEIQPLGEIDRTHIFRTMPDFSYSTSSHPIMSELKSKILPFQYPLIKEFEIDLTTRSNTSASLLPPPILSSQQIPFNYGYRQNPAAKRIVDPNTNTHSIINSLNRPKIYTYQLHHDTPAPVPSEPDPAAPPLESQPASFIGLVTLIRHIFTKRPIWTRRALMNQIPDSAPQFLSRYCLSYVAYAMRSGPWRDTYIRFGIDPRTDPSCRFYQTLMLQLVTSNRSNKAQREEYIRTWHPSANKQSHIFNSSPPFPNDGKAWQLVDLQPDPLMENLISTPDIRDVCEYRYFGWYKNGTIAKLKIVLKSKADDIMNGKTPDDTGFTRFLQLPNEYNGPTSTSSNPSTPTPSERSEVDPISAFLPRTATIQELSWATIYRSMCRAPIGGKPKSGRLSRSKPTVREGYLGGESNGNGEVGGRDGEDETELTPVMITSSGATTPAAENVIGDEEMDDVDEDQDIVEDMNVDDDDDEVDEYRNDDDENAAELEDEAEAEAEVEVEVQDGAEDLSDTTDG